MGIEYRIRCEGGEWREFHAFLRRQPFFVAYDEERRLYHLGAAGMEKRGSLPDCYAAVEGEGIYVCDNLTAPDEAAKILRRVIDEALRFSEKITIEVL